LLERRTQRILAVALFSVMLVTTDFVQPRLDYHVAAQAVAADYTPGDLIILESGWDDNAFRYEMTQALHDSNAPIIRTLPWTGNYMIVKPVVPQVEGDLLAHRRVWVVNWLQPPQVTAFLDKGGEGYIRVLSKETSVGKQYVGQYGDDTVREVLFERPELTTPGKSFSGVLSLRDTIL